MTSDMTPPPRLPSDQPGGLVIDGLPPQVMIRQFYLGCLSQASYLVADMETRRAIVVDPRRDIDELLEVVRDEELDVEYVLQTHFHADFLSGHLEFAAATGATIGYGRRAVTEFTSRGFADGEQIPLGGVHIEIWETPGHTPESVCILVRPGSSEDPVAVLSGDTLFIGDVGRPDLLVAADIPAEALATALHHSLQRIMTLPDSTLVLPAHGAGSACGKALSTETVSTIGAQRRENYALQPMSSEQFVGLVTEGQPIAPKYFEYDATMNARFRPIMDIDAIGSLGLEQFDRMVALGALAVDVRPAEEFSRAFLAGSISVPLTGRFAEQVGMVASPTTPIVLIGELGAAAEAQVRLARIGFDNVSGALDGIEGLLASVPDRARRQSRLTAVEFHRRVTALNDGIQIVDLRNAAEVDANPIAGATLLPLPTLAGELETLDPQRPIVVFCAGGARSSIASSILSAHGFVDVSDVIGGATALAAASDQNTGS